MLPYSPSLASSLILPTSLSIGEGILCILCPRSRRTGLFPTYYTPTFSFKKVRLFQHPQKDNKPLWSIFFKKGRIITITQQQGVSHFLGPRKKNQLQENCHAVSVKKTSQRLHKNIFNCMKVKRLVKNTISIAQTINLTVGQINDIDLK